MSSHKSKRDFEEMRGPIPVTVLSGFLGAGKTTLLKHILESKHKGEQSRVGQSNSAFRCAVIVNDMAELNIDEKLIVSSDAVVQSKDVIAMQNGCVCCTLKNDLVNQIIQLATSGNYDYLILEASGVSEPAEIAKLFQEDEQDHDCEGDHDHEEPHVMLLQVARLDTLATVVDASALLETNQELWLGTSTDNTSSNKNNLSQLLAEQVEFANVILINKMDLVTKEQMAKVIATRIRPLNAHANLLTCQNSRIDVHKVVDTRSYHYDTFGFEQLVNELNDTSMADEKKDDVAMDVPECCVQSKSQGLQACCPTKKKNIVDSGLSQVILAETKAGSRHDTRFGITSFLYRARRPFHPDRFNKEYISKFFLYYDPTEEEDEEEQEEDEEQKEKDDNSSSPDAMNTEEDPKQGTNENHANRGNDEHTAEAYRKIASQRKQDRKRELGELLRSKGFLWLADSHDMVTDHPQSCRKLGHARLAGSLVSSQSEGLQWHPRRERETLQALERI